MNSVALRFLFFKVFISGVSVTALFGVINSVQHLADIEITHRIILS